MKTKKYKFNIMVGKVEESYTGIFENYDLAIQWYNKHGKWLISQGTLPASGMTINVPSLVTSAAGGTGVAPAVTVEAEGGAVSNTDMVSQYLTGTVSKYSGMNTLSVELLERSDPNFYAELTQQVWK